MGPGVEGGKKGNRKQKNGVFFCVCHPVPHPQWLVFALASPQTNAENGTNAHLQANTNAVQTRYKYSTNTNAVNTAVKRLPTNHLPQCDSADPRALCPLVRRCYCCLKKSVRSVGLWSHLGCLHFLCSDLHAKSLQVGGAPCTPSGSEGRSARRDLAKRGEELWLRGMASSSHKRVAATPCAPCGQPQPQPRCTFRRTPTPTPAPTHPNTTSVSVRSERGPMTAQPRRGQGALRDPLTPPTWNLRNTPPPLDTEAAY